ncbi:YopT-type cysteine protease domain-containing protein [Aquimarina sediminis]|uniref:YopT-type cysteine protease domain-containing protein n=1 Tax=Aquimarina sediminis TaxID=2070536 RepID=UPI000CA076DD|nr:YopT-type cysteine protease domain-containing protein [Aquimarina sediminis]
MDKQTWIDIVKKYKGAFVVWVDQSSDSLLKEINSNGVCAAMAFDFVTAFQVGAPGPFNFLNDIRDTSKVDPTTNRIPAKYIEIQSALKAMLVQYKQNMAQLIANYKAAESANKPEVMASIRTLKSNRIKQRFGPGMDAVKEIKDADADLAPIEIFVDMNDIVEDKGPSYFFVGMRRDNGTGHAIAFGFRPDLSASSNFPGIFQFFDANLGQFTFGTEERLSDFFSDEVWNKIYKTSGYTKFEVVSFTAIKGRS